MEYVQAVLALNIHLTPGFGGAPALAAAVSAGDELEAVRIAVRQGHGAAGRPPDGRTNGLAAPVTWGADRLCYQD